jgi:hypothetical protein
MPIILTPSLAGGPSAMTFLQLCNRTARECGITRQAMTDVIGQTGTLADVVARTADAWREIQGERKFSWMWEEAAIDVATMPSGNIPAGRYITDSGRIGTYFLDYLPWNEFRQAWPDRTSTEQPTCWTVRPDMAVVFNTTPTTATTFNVERYRNRTELVLSTDTPEMPGHLHMAIVWKSVMTYASVGEEAGALYASALEKYKPILADILAEQTQPMQFGGALC